MPPMTDDSYGSRVEKWTMKEMQLNRLHEEIIARRESLLRSTGNYLRHQSAQKGSQHNKTSVQHIEDITLRNEHFLKDIRDTEQRLVEKASTPPDIRFQTLQSNYWAMIRNMQPLWERAMTESIKEEDHRQARGTTPRQPRTS